MCKSHYGTVLLWEVASVSLYTVATALPPRTHFFRFLKVKTCYVFYAVFSSLHGTIHLATIGFFPDVGTSHFAAHMGSAGRYIAMTTTRLNGIDLVAAGLATHFVPSAQIPALQAALLQCPGSADVATVVNYCENVLFSFSRWPTSVHRQPFESLGNVEGRQAGASFLAEYKDLIEFCFSESETVADVQIIFGK